MNKLTNVDGWINLILYGVIMTAFIVYKTKPDQDKDEHILANRKVSTLWGSFSVAVTWIWAPAIFVCGQKAFEEGLAGIFWFTLPNILCFFVFAPIGVKIRKLMPNAYSLPDFIYKHFHGHRGAHLSYVIVSIGIQISAIVINSLAGGLLLESLCGMNRYTVTVAISAIGLIYSVWRGLPASIITDFVQMIFILFIVFIIALWIVIEGGGINSLTHGLSGISGSSNIFNPWIAYSFGIPASIALITFPVADQMMFQRVMASRQKDVIKTFYYGGLIFGIVPVLLSLLGFIGAAMVKNGEINILNSQMVNVEVAAKLLPKWTLEAFVFMTLCALSSTLDSAYCAVGSLFSIDIYQKYLKPTCSDKDIVRISQVSMIVFCTIGTAIALMPSIKLLWVFFIQGCLASLLFMPTVLSLYMKNISAKAVTYAILSAFLCSVPLSIYANLVGSPHLIVAASAAAPLISGLVCILLSRTAGRMQLS